ncbi:MAG: polyphosphate kinase 1 [Tannerella sp.]|jgi:polyphosphate kinase|nr:polyphosphate kinase 1 [Tannerella sp.]
MSGSEKTFEYFKRDLSWLSFNYRVLLEAEDTSLPIYERIRFISIYSSNLEEFYEIRVAERRAALHRKLFTDESAEEIETTLEEIAHEVNRQQKEFYRIFNESILPELRRQKIYLYQDEKPKPFHKDFVNSYFNEEVFPFLSPVTILPGLRTFIRDQRLYLVIRMYGKTTKEPFYVLMKIPYAKVPRFIPLPVHDGVFYYMFIDDVIRANLPNLFPDYEIDGCFSIKISRDADIYMEEENPATMLQTIRTKVEKRKNGAMSRFMYDRAMPDDFLTFFCKAFDIETEDLVVGGRYMNLQDLSKLPNPFGASLTQSFPAPMRIACLDRKATVSQSVEERDVLLFFPYQSFDYLLRFMKEAASDPDVDAIKITQYRVAENSAVIDTLIDAAQNGKQVTVFVELKARFDEKNNMYSAERMEQAGIKIIYSLPKLKVHAKVAVILRKNSENSGFAYLSSGNFNEKTAKSYSDIALLTKQPDIIADINRIFDVLEQAKADSSFRRLLEEAKTEKLQFRHLLVSRLNMVDSVIAKIEREITNVKNGDRGSIILKMNGLHYKKIIDKLYEASEAGVEIDLIVRGACGLKPNLRKNPHLRITRIVDMYLEHARVWYFYNNGEEEVYLASADWMTRNLNRRIETACPVFEPSLKKKLIDFLHIQLHDNVKACFIDEHLRNIFKCNLSDQPPLRAQEAIREYLRKTDTEPALTEI